MHMLGQSKKVPLHIVFFQRSNLHSWPKIKSFGFRPCYRSSLYPNSVKFQQLPNQIFLYRRSILQARHTVSGSGREPFFKYHLVALLGHFFKVFFQIRLFQITTQVLTIEQSGKSCPRAPQQSWPCRVEQKRFENCSAQNGYGLFPQLSQSQIYNFFGINYRFSAPLPLDTKVKRP